MKLQDYDTTTRYTAKVVSNERLAAEDARREVHEIVIEVEDALHILPGQNLGLIVPADHTDTKEPHFRLYSVADLPERRDKLQQIHLCVRRCQYFDALTGQTHRGIASNFLCDCQPGDELTISGPIGQAFPTPENHHANLIMIGAGTGIAPFRAFLKHVYRHHPEFSGQVYLFYGGDTGLDLLYGNDRSEDKSMYYDRKTFEAIEALRQNNTEDAFRWSDALNSRAKELATLLGESNTYVYVAGLKSVREGLEEILAEVSGSNQRWHRWKQQLIDDGRWVELLY